MAIKNWHAGKIVLCWVAGLFMMSVSFAIMNEMPGGVALFLFFATFLVGSPIFLFVVTWKWISGKERTGPPTSK